MVTGVSSVPASWMSGVRAAARSETFATPSPMVFRNRGCRRLPFLSRTWMLSRLSSRDYALQRLFILLLATFEPARASSLAKGIVGVATWWRAAEALWAPTYRTLGARRG